MSLLIILMLSVVMPPSANNMDNNSSGGNTPWDTEDSFDIPIHHREGVDKEMEPPTLTDNSNDDLSLLSVPGHPLDSFDTNQLMDMWLNAESPSEQVEHIYSDPRYAEDFLWEMGIQLRHRKHFLAVAQWNYETNLTEWNFRQLEAEQSKCSNWSGKTMREVQKFKTANLPDTLKRQFQLLSVSINSYNVTQSREISTLQSHMISFYSSAEACLSSGNSCLPLEPDLVRLMAKSHDTDLLKEAWLKWRDASGRPMRDSYHRLVDLLNIAAVENGFSDYSQYEIQQAFYNTSDLEAMQARLWEEAKPLYKQLHAYVRHKLRVLYGSDVVGVDGTLPAHIMGNMWSQNWMELFNVVVPYPEVNVFSEVEAVLSSSTNDVRWMFRLAENFYRSLGLFPMTQAFWEKSMFEKPTDRNVSCHAQSYDMFAQGDFRIQMCTKRTFHDLLTVFHEMGHVTYGMAYASRPTVFRTGGSLATHEAVGDMVQLSLLSPQRLKAMGLIREAEKKRSKRAAIEKGEKKSRKVLGSGNKMGEKEVLGVEEKRSINKLMFLALKKIAFLPFGLLVDKWRYGVMRGLIHPHEYNKKWWELRLQYQGIRSPTPRSESDFDPGAKYHVMANSMFSGYFISHFQQFQMFSALCQEKDNTKRLHLDALLKQSVQEYPQYAQPHSHDQRPLHECDLYGSKEAGSKLRRFLSYGASIPWQRQLFELTGDDTVKADALLTYFRPLHQWLQKENERHGEKIGWEGANINWVESSKSDKSVGVK